MGCGGRLGLLMVYGVVGRRGEWHGTIGGIPGVGGTNLLSLSCHKIYSHNPGRFS